MPKNKFKEFLKKQKIVLLDGATGTELQRRGFKTTLPLWSGGASLFAPKLLEEIHRDYLKAGADILTTNTFRTQKRTFLKIKKPELAKKATISAVEIAQKVKRKARREIFVAGSISPLEDCYCPHLVPKNEELEKEHKEQIELLSSLGVDLILIETMNCLREAKIALKWAKKTKLPVFVSFIINPSLNLLSGESLEKAIKEIKKLKPDAILVNCIPPALVEKGLKKIRENFPGFIGAYAQGTGGPSKNEGWEFGKEIPPHLYLEYVKKWLKYFPKIVGGCCGTTPKHIEVIRKFLDTL